MKKKVFVKTIFYLGGAINQQTRIWGDDLYLQITEKLNGAKHVGYQVDFAHLIWIKQHKSAFNHVNQHTIR